MLTSLWLRRRRFVPVANLLPLIWRGSSKSSPSINNCFRCSGFSTTPPAVPGAAAAQHQSGVIETDDGAFSEVNLPRIHTLVAREVARFEAVFHHDDVGPGQALNEWVQTYYRRPRPDLLLGAIIAAMRVPGAFTGESSFAAAVFLSFVLRTVCVSTGDVANLVSQLRLAAGAEVLRKPRDRDGSTGSAVGHIAEQFDTVLRALYLAHTDSYDELLVEVSSSWVAELQATQSKLLAEPLAAGRASDVEEFEDIVALARSIFPPLNAAVRRQPLLDWPIPSLNMARFEQQLAAAPFSAYGGTRELFMHTRAGHLLAARDPAAFRKLSPHIACVVTKAMVDGYWSVFYATGDERAVLRVLDVGTPYVEFVDEYGDAPVVLYRPLPEEEEVTAGAGAAGAAAATVAGEGGVGPPQDDDDDAAAVAAAARQRWEHDFADDPGAALRFETSRYALWTLVCNAGAHAAVGELFLRHAEQVLDSVAMLDPVSRGDAVTAFGEKRVVLLRLLLPAVTELKQRADASGVGSGLWPESYTAGGGGKQQMQQLAASEPSSPLATGAAIDQDTAVDVGAAVAALLHAGGGGGGSGGGALQGAAASHSDAAAALPSPVSARRAEVRTFLRRQTQQPGASASSRIKPQGRRR